MFMKEEFYPTPKELLDQCFTGVQWKYVHTILEPSAGNGNIADYIAEKMKNMQTKSGYQYEKEFDLECIELDPELQHILCGKGYRVVHDNFLTFHTFKRYDLIVMNPPFSNGDKHLLHALDLQKDGGNIICILNAETIRNPYTNVRKDLLRRLDELHANITFISNAFSDAERQTDVEIAVIKVSVPERQKFSVIFDALKKKYYEDVKESSDMTELALNDYIAMIVKQFELEVEAGIRLIQEYEGMKKYLLEDNNSNKIYNNPVLELKCQGKEPVINVYVKKIRLKYWKALFADKRFTKGMVTDQRNDYMSQVKELAEYDFSLFNIKQIQYEMSKNLTKGIEECIVKLFDELSFQHAYDNETSKNIHYFNGWKTNKSWIVNKKVIYPFYMNAWNDILKNFEPDNYKIVEKLSDIEKALDYLSGNHEDGQMVNRLRKAGKEERTRKIPLKYFTVSFFKKGTCHIEFTDTEVWKKLNIFGSQQKKWLPPVYGKKSYEEMTVEEQSVIDEFEGKDSYERVFQNPKKYLFSVEENRQMLLGEIA